MPPRSRPNASSVHEARNALGGRLRELRQRAELTGRQLAESLDWPPSKVSKLENGRQTPTDADIREWTSATGAEDKTETLLGTLHTLETRYSEWQRQLRTGFTSLQLEILRRDARTSQLRIYETTVVPGLLQTPEYARHVFTNLGALHQVPDDVDSAVLTRMRRQDVLYQPDKRFHIVITEAVLHYRLCPPEAMLGQLDRLVLLSRLPNVRLGVIGFGTTYPMSPKHGFWLRDDELVTVETISAELNLTQPAEIATYRKAFDALAGAASYDRAARSIIGRVVEELATEVESAGPEVSG